MSNPLTRVATRSAGVYSRRASESNGVGNGAGSTGRYNDRVMPTACGRVLILRGLPSAVTAAGVEVLERHSADQEPGHGRRKLEARALTPSRSSTLAVYDV